MAHYAFLNNDHTTETLGEELEVLWSEMNTLTSIEEPTEEDTAAIEAKQEKIDEKHQEICLLYTSPSPRDRQKSRMPSSA